MKKKIIRKNKKFLTSILGRVGSYNISEYLKACKWQHQWDKSIKEAIKSHLKLPNFDKMFQHLMHGYLFRTSLKVSSVSMVSSQTWKRQKHLKDFGDANVYD